MDPPPPYSFAPLPTVTRWHPKMSPYRISVMLTTIILGASKAVFAYRGVSMVSTTLEWIAGVVFTLLIFALDGWESKEVHPKGLHWFFTFDCAELLWKVLSIPRPRYRSDEHNERLRNSPFIAVTGYRILVSSTVVLVGSVKAVLAFLGQNESANYLDWTLAVLMTSSLYYIGLYESNSINMAPNFFVRDHHTVLIRIARDILVMLVLTVSLLGFVAGFTTALSELQNKIHELNTTVYTGSNSSMVFRFLDISSLFLFAFTVATTSFGAIGASGLIVWALLQEPELFRFLFRFGRLRMPYDSLTNGALRIIAALTPMSRRARRFVSATLWIGVHVFGIAILSNIFLVIVFVMRLFGEDLHGGAIAPLIGAITMQVILGVYAIIMLWCTYYVARSMISPFLSPVRPIVFW